MDIRDLLKSKKFEFKNHPDGLLFPIDWDAVRKTNRCPLCGCKLYDMRSKPYTYCKSKKHKRFVIKKWSK